MSIFAAYLNCILDEVLSFAEKNLVVCGILTVVFTFNNSGGVFH